MTYIFFGSPSWGHWNRAIGMPQKNFFMVLLFLSQDPFLPKKINLNLKYTKRNPGGSCDVMWGHVM